LSRTGRVDAAIEWDGERVAEHVLRINEGRWNRTASSETRRCQLSNLRDYASTAQPQFGTTVSRYDSNGDGIPDRELEVVYDELFDK
jgi:hypothetical protein